MHDVSDDAVEEYFRGKLQLPYFVSLENDEFLFWHKLAYHLYTNNASKQAVMPVYELKEEKSVIKPHLKYIDSDRSSDDVLIDKKRSNYNLYDLRQTKKQARETQQLDSPLSKGEKESKTTKKVKSKFLLDELPASNLNTQLSIAYINDVNSYYSYDHHTHKVKSRPPKVRYYANNVDKRETASAQRFRWI